MISTIISIGAFVIGVIVIYYVAMISIGLVIRFWHYIAGFIVIAAVAIFAITATQARADSIDVGYMYHINQAYSGDDVTIGFTSTVNDMFDVKMGISNGSSISGYFLGRVKHTTKYIDYGINFGLIKSKKSVTEPIYKYARDHEKGSGVYITQIGTQNVKAKGDYVLTAIPTITFKYKVHAVEIGYIGKFLNNEEARIFTQYQYSF